MFSEQHPIRIYLLTRLFSFMSVGIIFLSGCSKKEVDCQIMIDFTKFEHTYFAQVNDTLLFKDDSGQVDSFSISSKEMPQSVNYTYINRLFDSQEEDILPLGNTPCQTGSTSCQIRLMYSASLINYREGSLFSLSNTFIQAHNQIPPQILHTIACFWVGESNLGLNLNEDYETEYIINHAYLEINNKEFDDVIQYTDTSDNDISEIFVTLPQGIIAYKKRGGNTFLRQDL